MAEGRPVTLQPVREEEASAVNMMAIVVGHVFDVPVVTRSPCKSAKDCSVEQFQTAWSKSGGRKKLKKRKSQSLPHFCVF